MAIQRQAGLDNTETYSKYAKYEDLLVCFTCQTNVRNILFDCIITYLLCK